MHRRLALIIGALGLLVAILMVPAGSARAAAVVSASASPTSGLTDGEHVSVVLSGASPGSEWIVVDCGPKALAFDLTPGSPPSQDGCEQRSTWMMPVDAGGVGALQVSVKAKLTTAAGPVDCTQASCFLALENWTGSGLQLISLHFAATACAATGSCVLAPDAWDPSLGVVPSTPGGAALPVETGGIALVSPGHPATVPVTPSASPDISTLTTIPGPYTGSLVSGQALTSGMSGTGLLELAMSAPSTSWGPGSPSSVVADVSITDTTSGVSQPTQQIVMFEGSTPFIYSGFAGSITGGDRYAVRVVAEADARLGGLSQVPAGQRPQIIVDQVALMAATAATPNAMLETYAPVMFGRSTSALHDTPVLVAGSATAGANGTTNLSYEIIWSHEDAGTAFVPILEWAGWGRLTDIESAVNLTVASDGTVTSGSYLWGGVPKTGWPDSDGARQEVDKSLPLSGSGSWYGTHPILRDATGNNDLVSGTSSRFRFQLLAVAGPASGQTRESIENAFPFTYSISAAEIPRWYTNVDTNPLSPETGQASQYALVDLATSSLVPSVHEAVQLEVGGVWYSQDLGWGTTGTLASPGHEQTTVKLPLGWSAGSVQGARVAVVPASNAGAVTVSSLTVSQLGAGNAITPIAVPGVPGVVGETPGSPAAFDLVGASVHAIGTSGHRWTVTGAVTDAFGHGLAGVTMKLVLPAGYETPSCRSCHLVTISSSGSGGFAATITSPTAVATPTVTLRAPDVAVAPVVITG